MFGSLKKLVKHNPVASRAIKDTEKVTGRITKNVAKVASITDKFGGGNSLAAAMAAKHTAKMAGATAAKPTQAAAPAKTVSGQPFGQAVAAVASSKASRPAAQVAARAANPSTTRPAAAQKPVVRATPATPATRTTSATPATPAARQPLHRKYQSDM